MPVLMFHVCCLLYVNCCNDGDVVGVVFVVLTVLQVVEVVVAGAGGLWPMSLWGKENDQRRYQRQTTSSTIKVTEVDGWRFPIDESCKPVLHFPQGKHISLM